MNRVQLLSNVSKCKIKVIEKKREYEGELSFLSIKSMSSGEVLNSQKAWELEGKIEAMSEVLQTMTNHSLFYKV